MKFVHAADLHLDSPLRGLGRYEGAPVEAIRGATRRALENLVELCLEERAELLVIAGDLYDDDWRDYSTGLFFTAQMARLREAGIRVAWIRGNHDAASKLTRHLRLPENVHELSFKQPGTLRFESIGVAVHGQGFETREVKTDLSLLYPAPDRDLFNIGLLHTALDGREGHAPYAPCRLAGLVDRGYEYWALGHVHQREVLHRDPWVVFPGNLQGRHAREIGPKGATLVSVEGERVVSAEHRSLDEVRWQLAEADASQAENLDDVLGSVRAALGVAAEAADGRLAAVRVRIAGVSHAHAAVSTAAARIVEEVRALGLDLGGAGVWVEKVEFATRSAFDPALLRQRDDAIGQVLTGLRALAEDESALGTLRAELAELARRLPPELASGPDGVDLESPVGLRALLANVEKSIVPLLEGSEDSGA